MRNAKPTTTGEALQPDRVAPTVDFRPTHLHQIAASMADLMRSVAQHRGAVVAAGLVSRINDTLRDWEAAIVVRGDSITRGALGVANMVGPACDLSQAQGDAGNPVSVQVLCETAGDGGAAQADQLAREALSAVSWLYRRLPRGYGRQQHIEVVIERLARETGTGLDYLVERSPDPATDGAR